MELEVRNTGIPAHIVKLWQRIVDAIAVSLAVPSAMINRLEPPDLEIFRSSVGSDSVFLSGSRMSMAGIYCEAAARKREMIKVTDARKNPEWANSPTAKAGIYAYLGYPIFWPDGEVFGTLCVIDTKENNWGKLPEDLLLAFKEAVEEHLALISTFEELEKKNEDLEHALSQVKILKGLLPICSYCKNIRDDNGDWKDIESYIKDRSDVDFTHSVCPACENKIYPGLRIINGK